MENESLFERSKETLVDEWKKRDAENEINNRWMDAHYSLDEYGSTYSAMAKLGQIEKCAAEADTKLPPKFFAFKEKVGKRGMREELYKLRKALKSGDSGTHELFLLKYYASEGGITVPKGLETVANASDTKKAYETLGFIFPEIKNKYDVIKGALEANPDALVRERAEGLVYVAPKKETYDIEELQKFMEGLIPFGLEPDFQRDFADRSGYWRLGELTFGDVETGKEFRIKVYPSETIANKFAQPNYENPKAQSVI